MAKQVDQNGFWLIESNPVTKEGVFPYLGSQIDFTGSLGLEPNKIYNVYRPASELSKAETVKSFNGVPFINEHEMIGEGCTDYDVRPAGGILFNPKFETSGSLMLGDFKIFSEDLKSEIEGGKKELSLGYRCAYKPQRGVFNGKTYDFIQCDIIGNHVALVDKGRMGSDVRVYDSKANVFDRLDISPDATITKGTDAMKKTLAQVVDEALRGKVSDEELKKIQDSLEEPAEEKKDEEKKEEAPAKDEEASEEEKDCSDESSEEKKDEEKAEDDDRGGWEHTKGPGGLKGGWNHDEKEEESKKETAEDSMKSILKMIADRDAIVKQVEPLIGAFDHAVMTVEQVAAYACDKLKLGAEKGEERAVLKGFIAGKGQATKVFSMDAAPVSTGDIALQNYLAGK